MECLSRKVFGTVLFAVGLIVFLFSHTPAYAVKSIPDGGETNWESINEAKNVNREVREMWENKQIPRGGKHPVLYSPTSGNNLIYDVYAGTTNQSKKQGFRVISSDNVVSFDGWAIIKGHHHHAKQNQATYIGLVNKNNSDDRLIFKTFMRGNTSANDEIHDRRLNLCPSTAKNRPVTYGEDKACNMDYQYTQFRAYIDMREVFRGENANKEWEMYIIKRVEDRIVYDRLVLPFDTEEWEWENGKVTMKSGQDAKVLRMVGYDVVKRSNSSGGGDPGGDRRYFAPLRNYTSNGLSETPSSRVAVWYRVYDDVNATIDGRRYEATNSNRWTASTFWEFGGSIATLAWKRTKADVTINHIDRNTNTVIDNEKRTVNIGSRLTLSPKTTLKDGEGHPYIPVPENQRFNEIINDNRTVNFYYKASLPDPTNDNELPDTTDGNVEGKAFWELRKENEDSESVVYAESNFIPTGNHYAIRNVKHTVELGDHTEISENPIALTAQPNLVKNQDMKYEFEYEFTNYYRNNYECVDEQGEHCFEWRFKDRTPIWENGEVFHIAENLRMDHRHGETISKDTIDEILQEKLLVGRSDEWTGKNKETTNYYEQFSKLSNEMKMKNELKTQSTLLIKPDSLKYQVSVPSEEHKNSGFTVLQKGLVSGRYFPADIDESLKEDFANHWESNLGEYAIFLQQSEMKDKGVQTDDRVFEMEFVSDYFFISEHTGFIVGYPYAYELNRHLLYGEQKPTNDKAIQMAKQKMEQEYFRQTGQEFRDHVLYVDSEVQLADWNKFQRYYIPISPTSQLEPNTTYTNNIILENIGLNDVTWRYGQEFSFDHYLFGSGHDDAWIIEQPDSRIDVKNENVNTIIIKDEDKESIVEMVKERPIDRLHQFRVTDRNFIDQIKGVIGDWNN